LEEEGLDKRIRPAHRGRRGDPRGGQGMGEWKWMHRPPCFRGATAVMVPDGHIADALRKVLLEKLRHVAGHWYRKANGQGIPDRPNIGAFQRT